MRLAPWSRANSSWAWLSIVEVSATLKMFGETGVVMPSWTDAMMTTGIFASSRTSRAAKVALLQPPPMIAKTLSSIDQLLDRADGRRRIAAIVLAHQLELAAVDAAGRVDLVEDDLDAVHRQLAVEIAGSGQRAERADLDRVGRDAGHLGLGRLQGRDPS